MHERIAVRHPVERIRTLESRVRRDHVRRHFAARVGAVARRTILMFAVRCPGDDGRRRLLVSRAEDVDQNLDAVAQRNPYVALDDHRLFDAAALNRVGRASLLGRRIRLAKTIFKSTRPHRCRSSSWPKDQALSCKAVAIPWRRTVTKLQVIAINNELCNQDARRAPSRAGVPSTVAPAWISSNWVTTCGVLQRPMPHSVAMPNFGANLCAARMRRCAPSTPSAAWTQPR